MSVEIQEPNDLPPNAITDDNADHFEILVYEQSQDVAGIKRLGIAGWKTYLGFNTHKVNNVANYLGIPNEFPWDSPQDETWEDPDLHRYTITHQVQALADKIGISTEPQTPFPTILPRVVTLENQVQTPTTGLIDKMSSAESRLDAIETEIGSGTPAPSSLSGRIQELEDKVGQEASGGQPATRLMKVEEDVEASGTGLMDRMTATETNVTALQTAVNDPDTGLAKLNDIVQNPDTGLVKKVNDLESKVYFYKGNITDVTNSGDTTTAITVDGTTIQVTIDNLENGWVYNINPSAPGVDSLIINGEKYNKGENVAIINDGSTIKFDKLGANIDVAEVEEIKEKVDAMSMVEIIDSSWTSTNIPDGIYQCSSICRSGGQSFINSFIISFANGVINTTTQKVDISGNFDTYWEIDVSGYLKPKALTSSATRKLSIHKIGEI